MSTTNSTSPLAMLSPEDQAKMIILSDPMGFLLPYILSLPLDSIALGIILHQFGFWLTKSAKKDPLRIKIIVCLVVSFCIAFTVYWIYYMVQLFVVGFGTNYLAFLDNKYSAALPIFHSATVVMSHIFYTERAYKLNGRNKIVLIVLCPLILLAFAAGPVTSAKLWYLKSIMYSQQATPQFLLLTISAILTDVAILGMVTRGLWKSKTGWSSTDRLITRLIRLAFETQTPGTIGAIIYLIFYHTKPSSGFNYFLAVALPKIYTSSLMVVLNSRMNLNQKYTSDFNEYRHEQPGSTGLSKDSRIKEGKITVSTERWEDVQSHSMPEIISINRRHLGTTEEVLDSNVKQGLDINSSSNANSTSDPSINNYTANTLPYQNEVKGYDSDLDTPPSLDEENVKLS